MFYPENEYYIWAAGTYGRRLINFLRENAPSLKVVGFIDNDPKKQGTIYHGLPVLSWDEAKVNVPRIRIIISLSLPTQLRDFLLGLGYIENEEFFLDFRFIPRYFWATKKKIFTPTVLVPTNNNCCCNCDGCYAFIPYVKKPFVSTLESLKKTVDFMFNHLDKCLNINMCGGETLLNNKVADLCCYFREKYSNRFGTISLVTSGIIIPSDEEMEKFAYAKPEIAISDYTKTDERAKKNMPLLIEKCEKYGVHYYINRQSAKELWFDIGNPYEINITDPEELKVRFSKCFKPVSSVFVGKLYACFYQNFRYLATGISEPHGDDSFDLSRVVTEDTREELYNIISFNPKLGYYTGCAHCGGTFTPYQPK